MTYSLEPGRHIYCDGKPFVSIGREGETLPTEADTVAHAVRTLLSILDTAGVDVVAQGRDNGAICRALGRPEF